MSKEKIEVQEQNVSDKNTGVKNLQEEKEETQMQEENKTEDKKVEEQNTEEQNIENKPKKKGKIVAIISICLLFVLIVGVLIFYWRVAAYYETHFFPNTTINGFVCDELDAKQVTIMLDSQIQEYSLEVIGRLNEEGDSGVVGTIVAQDVNLHYLGTQESVENLLEEQNEWMWIETLVNKAYSHVLVQCIGFDEKMLTDYVKEWDAFQNMKKPQDAYISTYSEESGYKIVPETKGNEADIQSAIEWISGAIQMQETEVDLDELGCYAIPSVKADDEELNKSVNEANKWLATEITYDWNGKEIVVDKKLIAEWVTFEGNEPKLNEEAVSEFVKEQARELDTYGKNRYFTTTLGVQLNLPSGAYGWKTDKEGEAKELIELIYQGSIENREPVYTNKGRWKGVNDIGNSYVEADLTNQHLYLYWQGNLVLETDFVSGNPNWAGCLTPQGVFGLTYKTKNAVLRGENYETPVSYWMPFYGNFGMHDATWRSEFGGDIYLTNGSHGCLNLPLDKAEAIYGYLSEGFPIICYYY